MAEKTAIKLLVYVGQNGRHLAGIPAQSLDESALARLTPDQVDNCLASGLYIEGPVNVDPPPAIDTEPAGDSNFDKENEAPGAPLED